MIEKIETFLRDLISSLQIAKLYTVRHPRFNKFMDRAFVSLQEAFEEKDELVIGIVGNELAFEKEILFELSRTLSSIIEYLKERGIEKIIFFRGITREELAQFIDFLASSKEEIAKDAQEYLLAAGVKNISVGKIQSTIVSSDKLKNPVGPEDLYIDSSRQVTASMEKLLSSDKVDYFSLRFTLKNLLENLLSQHCSLLTMATVKRYDLSTFVHSLNVSLLSMYFSAKLGFTKEDCLDIGVAALFHDIGKLYISRRIIQKPGKLNEEEFTQIKNHVTLGAEILLKYVDNIGILPLVVCLEHHMRYDLTGYPRLPYLRKPHLASLIISTCDVYDALSLRRNYKNDYPPDMIYEIMIKEKGKYYEGQLLDAFFKIMGVWPLGTIVALSDKRIAVVREENAEDIFSPKVEIISPERTGQFIDLKITKDSLKVEKFLNPWKKDENFLSLIRESNRPASP